MIHSITRIIENIIVDCKEKMSTLISSSKCSVQENKIFDQIKRFSDRIFPISNIKLNVYSHHFWEPFLTTEINPSSTQYLTADRDTIIFSCNDIEIIERLQWLTFYLTTDQALVSQVNQRQYCLQNRKKYYFLFFT